MCGDFFTTSTLRCRSDGQPSSTLPRRVSPPPQRRRWLGLELATTEGNDDLVENLNEYRAKVVADWHHDNPMPTCGGEEVCPGAAHQCPISMSVSWQPPDPTVSSTTPGGLRVSSAPRFALHLPRLTLVGRWTKPKSRSCALRLAIPRPWMWGAWKSAELRVDHRGITLMSVRNAIWLRLQTQDDILSRRGARYGKSRHRPMTTCARLRGGWPMASNPAHSHVSTTSHAPRS